MRRLAIGIALVLAVVLAGSVTQAAPKRVRIGMVVETLGNPWFSTMKAGAEAEAKLHPEVELTVLGAASGTDLAGMTKMIEDLIQKKVDVLAFNAIDPQGSIPVVKKAQAAGIAVMIHSDDVAQRLARHFIGPDQYKGQNEIGKWLITRLNGAGKIGVLEGVRGNMSNQLRLQGLRDALKAAPGIKIASILAANYARDQGLRKAEDMLTANPDIRAIVAINDDMALGAVAALKARNLAGKVIVTGFNGVEEAVQEVYRGNMGATVIAFADEVGRQIVLTGIKVANKQDDPKQYIIDTGTLLVDSKLLDRACQFLKCSLGK